MFNATLIMPVKSENLRNIDFQKYLDFVSEILIVHKISASPLGMNLISNQIRLIDQETYTGKGSAIIVGLLNSSNDINIVVDADEPISVFEIESYLSQITNNADIGMVKGSRFLKTGGSEDLTIVRYFGALFFAKLTRLFFKVNWTDVVYGFWAINRKNIDMAKIVEVLESPKTLFGPFKKIPYGHSFEFDQVLMLKSLKSGAKILELPSFELARNFGKSSLTPLKDGFRTLIVILFERFYFK
jgi:glycosyltransferase involved in cell wall biosynthesis